MSLVAPIAALLLAIVGVALARREGPNRALRLAVPLAAIPIACMEAFFWGRATLPELETLALDAAVEDATHAWTHMSSTEAFGLVCAVGACLVVAFAEAAKGELVNPRAGQAIALGAFLGAAVVAGLSGGGTLTLTPALALLLVGLSCALSAAYRVEDAEEAVSRTLAVALLGLAAMTAMVMVQDDLWLLYGTDELRANAAAPAAVLAFVLGLAAVLTQRFWEVPDRFGTQLVLGLALGGAALMLRMPGMFVMDRLLQITPGGQAVVLEKRLMVLPTSDDQARLQPVEILDGIQNDGHGWWSTMTGRPVEFPLDTERVAVGARATDASTVLTDTAYAEHEVELEVWVQVEPPDGGHPLASHERYRWVTLTWMPEVEPTWSPDAPILEGETVQDLVDACLEGSFDLCRITPGAPAPGSG